MSASAVAPEVRAYLEAFESSSPDNAPADHARFVVLDTETTGLDLRRDRIITIGAVAVTRSQIDLSDVFEALLRIEHNQSSVTVHGITRDEARAGMDEPQALLAFLSYLGNSVIVGHHIGFDIDMLNEACERHFGITLRNRCIDTMELTLRLQELAPLEGEQPVQAHSLDALCVRFGVLPRDRHTAAGDAFMTALVFLKLLSWSRRSGCSTLRDVCVPRAGQMQR